MILYKNGLEIWNHEYWMEFSILIKEIFEVVIFDV